MNEMVERVARAMHDSDRPDRSWDTTHKDTRDCYIDRAISAIQAMREPTASMEDAGKRQSLADGAHDCEVPMGDVYRAMIDAAMRDENGR